MATTKNKISVLVPEQLPDFIKSDHPDFVNFLKTYYEFLESAELKLKTLGNNDSILNEEGTTTYILLEDDNPYRKDEKNTILLNDYNQTWVGGAAVGTPTVETPVGGDTLTGAFRERTSGSFINGETITGQTSKATATIRAEDINDNSRIFISAQNKFLRDEQIIGATSNASAYIESYTANPVQNVSDLLEYADVDDTIDAFFDQFKEAFMRTIPRKLATDITVTDEAGTTRLVDLKQRNILKNIRDLYRAKGSRRGHEIFFRLLLGENVELFYPTENMLRVSDGKWEDPSTLRIVQVNDSILMENDENQQIYLVMEDGQHIEQEGSTLLDHDMNKLVGSTITQDAARDLTIDEGQPHHPDTTVANGFAASFVANVPTGGYTEIGKATATVEGVTQIQLGSVVLYDLTLTEGSIVGTFLPGQRIYGKDNTNAARNILGKNTSMLSSISLTSSGQYFTTSDALTTSSDVGIGAALSIDAVSAGKISNIEISSVGTGYAIGDQVTVTDTGTSGTGLSAEVSIVNGGIAPETGSLIEQFRFTTESGTAGYPGELLTEDTTTTYFNQEEDYGMTATDHFVLEDQTVISDNTPGIKFVQEYGTGTGDITDVRVKGIGNNYNSLPTLKLPETLDDDLKITTTIRVRTARILAEDSNPSATPAIENNILTEDGDVFIMEHIGVDTHEVTQKSGTFIVGETIKPVTQPASTTTGTVRKHYEDPQVPDHFFIDFASGVGTIAVGQTVQGQTSGVHGEVLTTKVRSGGKIIAMGDSDVGQITSVKVIEPGIHYTEEPTLSTVINILVTAPSANFVANGTITGGTSGATAVIKTYDSETQLIKATSVTGTFVAAETITESGSGTTATINSANNASFTSNIGATGVFGKYINEDGFISEDSKKIQDSYYYQDFSYVVKTATSITVWKDELLATAHPSGFALFSQINPVNALNLRIKTSSTVPDLTDARETFTPDLFTTFRTIFTTQLGRRLGGTAQTLSSAPLVGVPSGTALSNDKDVSLTHHIILDRNLRQERARKGSAESIIYPTITIAASTGATDYIGDSGWIRKNIDRWKFVDSYGRSADSATTFRSHNGFYDKRELTTLDGAINTSATTIALTSAAQFPTSGTIVIESEQITYTGKSSNNLTGCTRGANSTTAATHADDVNVYNYKFVVTQNEGTYTFEQLNAAGLTFANIRDLPGAKFNAPAPSEITITVT